MPVKTDDREKALRGREKNIVVTASAGAGKTTAMVARVLDLIRRDNVPARSIVMLTFADAAAEEMRSRLSEKLLEEIKKASGEERSRLIDAYDDLPFLHCSTIDSFCFSLVKAHFELLGLSPAVKLMDEETAASYRKKALKKTLTDFAAARLAEDADDYYRFILSFGAEEEAELEKSILSLYDYAEMTVDGDEYLSRAAALASSPADSHPAIKDFVNKVKQNAVSALMTLDGLHYDPACATTAMADYYRKYRAYMCAFAEAPEDLDSLVDIAKSVETVRAVSKNVGEKYPLEYAAWERVAAICKDWKDNGFILKDGLKLLKQTSAESLLSLQKDVLTVVDLTKRFKENYQAVKDEEQRVDFSDVEHYALALLRDHPVVKEEIGCLHLMMDEAQDLNYLQNELMLLIAERASLFVVGDVKQCIFRFRNAMPKLFGDRADSAKARADSVLCTFNENFRSSQAVIDFVNLLFGNLMTKEFGGIDYPKAVRGGEFEGDGKVECFFYPAKEEEAEPLPVSEVYSVKRAAASAEKEDADAKEAAWVRDRILELVRPASGVTILHSPKDNEEKRISFKDIAILSPVGLKTDSLQEKVVNCLREAGIPLNVGGFVRDVENADVTSLVDFFRLLLSKHDDFALLSVLRSDLFSFTVEELAEIAVQAGADFSERAQNAALSEGAVGEKLRKFYAYLQKCRALSSSLSLYELASRIVEERLRTSVAKRADGRAVLGQVLAFVETLRGGKQTGSIPEYIEFFDNYYKMELEGEIAERDAVTVMTMHKSKGLQFPVVFVIGMGKKIINSMEHRTVVRMDGDYGVCKKSAEDKDLLFELFHEKKNTELKEDCLRLLYVAFTRAENYLYISGSVPSADSLENPMDKSKAHCCSQLVLDGLKGSKVYFKDYSSVPAPVEEARAVRDEADPSEVETALAALRKGFAAYPYEKATKTGIKYTVTAINAMKEEGCPPATEFFAEEKKAQGTAYHAVMENLIPFAPKSAEETVSLIDAFVGGGLITEEERVGLLSKLSPSKITDGVQKILSLTGTRPVKCETGFLLHLPAREAGVADVDDEVEVQGKIDLLAVGREDAVIVDYKFSLQSARELKETYRAQLDLYALAVQKSYGLKTVRKYIFVPGRNELIEM